LLEMACRIHFAIMNGFAPRAGPAAGAEGQI
jgi:hypothetical protein